MGVVIGSLWAVGITLGGAALTALLEPRLFKKGADPGPAAKPTRGAIQIPGRDRWLYPAGPALGLFGVALAAIVLPFGPDLIGADLGIGVFYFIVLVDFVVLGVAVGGWGSNVKTGVEGFYRIVAQLVAYVVPLGLAYIGAIMMARSLSTVKIVDAQRGLPFLLLQPLGFGLYVITGLMQSYRAPFMEPFSASIEHGVLKVYGGWQGMLWRAALSGVLFVVAAAGAVLYLGGWRGPLLPGPVWMLLKTLAMMVFMVWVGRQVKPLSTAKMLELSWKVFTPVGLLNVLIVGALILLGVGPS